MVTTETTEIDIHLDTIEGLARFVAFITDQYGEFLAAAENHQEDVAVMVTIKAGKDAYERLRDAIAIARGELVAGEVVSNDSLSVMQHLYDEFSEAYLTVTEYEPAANELAEKVIEPVGVAITPRFAIRERFEQSLEDVMTAEAVYAPVAESVDETTLPYLTYQQLEQYKTQLRKYLSALKRLTNDDRTEIEFLHKESLEIERGVLRAAAALEDMFPNEVRQVESVSPEPASVVFKQYQKPFLTERLREDEDVETAAKAFFPSLQKFETALWQRVAKIEEPSKLDKVLQVKHGSIFEAILKGMTLAEVDALRELSGEQVRTALLEMEQEDKVQYDYTIFIMWMDEYEVMTKTIETYPDMYFEELIAITDLIERELDGKAD